MRGALAPSSEPVRFRELLATMRSEKAVDWLEQRNVITAEHRAGNGAAARAVDEIVDSAAGGTRGLTGTAGATAGATAAGSTQYANPIYNGLMAQSLMREHGFVAPTAAPDGVIPGGGAADDVRLVVAAADPVVDAPIAAAADDVATHVAGMEQRMVAALQRLGELPQDSKIPVLSRAVDATAAHGGDSYDVLARALLERPLDEAVVAFERSLDDAAKVVAPIVDDAARVVTPIADDAAKVVAPRLLATGGDDALRGVMSFSAGIDDTLRLLAKF